MSNFKEVHNKVSEFFKNLKANMEKDPRYLINHLAKNGEIRVYFDPDSYKAYLEGQEVRGSTERFGPSDIFLNVPTERIDKITDGMTIVHILAVKEE